MRLDPHEVIDHLNVCTDGTRIRGVTFNTNLGNCCIMDGAVEVSRLVDIPESVLAESEMDVHSQGGNFGELRFDELSEHHTPRARVE